VTTWIFRPTGPMPTGRRGRAVMCALHRQAAGATPTVNHTVIALGILLLIVVVADIAMVLGVLV
jgi:hypothetical protein